MGVDFNDEVQALWILGSLPDSWETSNGTVKNKRSENSVAMVDQSSDLIVVGSDVCYASIDDDWVIDTAHLSM
ncbi:hypothetical protein LIER_17871 [Lithospermum erythrorhizon]|uniref:Uncharacterized protein n=1 Tax=Lithospermum erythrorhizon TaxID=34254 RepID=A0AAV3QEG0_LITER